MSIWNDPEITFQDFASYLLDDKNKSGLEKIWTTKTKNKSILSELESHELSDILVSFMKQCIKSKQKNGSSTNKPSSDQLQDASHLFSDWIVENKLTGIPDEDYGKMTLKSIFDNKLIFQFISEASQPLKSYIESKNQHDPSLSQQEIQSKNRRMIQKHPSLAHLFQQKIVNKTQNEFNDYDNAQKQKENEEYIKKSEEAKQNVHQIRQSRAMLFFNHSEVGYETKKKCKIYKDAKLTEFLIEVEKGELMGGKTGDKSSKVIELIEPIKGFIASKYVKSFELDSAQWKFLQHQRSMTSVGGSMSQQSLTLRIKNEDLLLPSESSVAYAEDVEIDVIPPDDDDMKEEEQVSSKRKVKFSGAYNENEDEKKQQDNPTSFVDPVKNSKESFRDKRLRKCKEKVSAILNVKKSKRTPQQVLDLWTAGFNLHDISILKKCYSPQVTSQQFVNMELNARDPILQCFKQMFEASDDVGLDVTNCILKDGAVILEFRTYGTRKGHSNGSPTNSSKNGNGNGNGSNNNNNEHLLASPATKSGLPQKVINGVGVFHVNDGQITGQKLFWDQDQQFFADMNVIKMPQSSTLSHLLLQRNNKISPILNLSDEHLESGSSNGSDGNNGNNGYTVNGDNDIMYEMDEEMNEILALRGINLNDLQTYEDKKKSRQQSQQKQMAQAMFWIAVGAMFVFIVPKYLGKGKK